MKEIHVICTHFLFFENMKITPEQEKEIMARATHSVENIIKLYRLNPIVNENLIKACIDSYIAGATDTITYLQSKI